MSALARYYQYLNSQHQPFAAGGRVYSPPPGQPINTIGIRGRSADTPQVLTVNDLAAFLDQFRQGDASNG